MSDTRPVGSAGKNTPKAVLFDFGGVLAEEGFRLGLHAIAAKHGINPDQFFRAATEAIYQSGFVVGRGSEDAFWQLLQQQFSIKGSAKEWNREFFDRFVLRPRMMAVVRVLRQRGIWVGILSDQTQMLEQLDRRDHFFEAFDHVFNSFRLGKSKRDPSLFDDAVAQTGFSANQVLFVDDNLGNVERARSRGLATIWFVAEDGFMDELNRLLDDPLIVEYGKN
jgi:putative hydrolase of the HAD superfamily